MTRQFMLEPEKIGNNNKDVVPEGEYTVEVADARSLQDRDFIWLDLQIVGGVDDGHTVSVSLNMPNDSASPGAQFYFEKKLHGFLPVVSHVWKLPDEDQPAALAAAMIGKRVLAKLSIQKDGQYKGSQQLEGTQQLVEVAPAMRAVPTSQSAGTAGQVEVGTQTTIAATANEPTDPPF